MHCNRKRDLAAWLAEKKTKKEKEVALKKPPFYTVVPRNVFLSKSNFKPKQLQSNRQATSYKSNGNVDVEASAVEPPFVNDLLQHNQLESNRHVETTAVNDSVQDDNVETESVDVPIGSNSEQADPRNVRIFLRRSPRNRRAVDYSPFF